MMDKAIHGLKQGPALDHALSAPGAAMIETHARLARATNVRIHRIGDDESGNDALGAAVAPQRPRVAATKARTTPGAQTASKPYHGTITPPRITDVRPPYRPPVMLRQASLRAREAQPPLLNMGTATGAQPDDRERNAAGWRER
ncbi:hypothetical protein [Achromobacter aloeverae]|uniref:Uncharacterized protein n=1 Tax=Achromobacter aloeverae TaxID=1750518 RepID=A0A4Q1HE69_9BURK|nr:hypothetical protein [Achromobacter aloeverae]RXN84461.1 hypothetical protein C7R54_24060 [Achromobacter aloeverae]